MSRLAARPEQLKLCQLLGADPASLPGLARLSPRALRQLRLTLWAERQRRDARHLRPLLAVARWLPAGIAAWCSERWLGLPLVAALAGELSLQQTLGIARLLSPARLADVCTQLDPRAAHDLVHVLPEARVVAVARELLGRGDHMTLGRFADHLGDAALTAVLAVIDKDADLLDTVYFIESRSRLDHILRLLPEERRQRLMQLLLDGDGEHLRQILFLLTSLSPALQAELGGLAVRDAAVLARIIELVHAGAHWADLLGLLLALAPADQALVLAAPAWREQPVLLQSLLEAADHEQLWLTTLPLCALMDEPLRARCAGVIAGLPQGIGHVTQAALSGEHWPVWLSLLAAMPLAPRQEFAHLLRGYGDIDPSLWRRLVAQAGPLAPLLLGDEPATDPAPA